MRKVKFVLKFILACVIGIVLQLTLHEMGHALFAIITGNEVTDISLGIVSFAEINVKNTWSIPIISLGSFIFPVTLCLLLEFIPCIFTKMLNTIILTITAIQLGINSVAICLIKDYATLQTYDLGVIVTSSNLNNILIACIGIIFTVALFIWSTFKLVKIANEF